MMLRSGFAERSCMETVLDSPRVHTNRISDQLEHVRRNPVTERGTV